MNYSYHDKVMIWKGFVIGLIVGAGVVELIHMYGV
jgi:hypothetical protein